MTTLAAEILAAVGAFDAAVRRAAVVEYARAVLAYQPASYDDAAALRDGAVELIDAEMADAGDAGEDDTYATLGALRSALCRDIASRGADLAPMRAFVLNGSLPALAIANRLYRDAARVDALVIQVDPEHPLFMPQSFTALAA